MGIEDFFGGLMGNTVSKMKKKKQRTENAGCREGLQYDQSSGKCVAAPKAGKKKKKKHVKS